MKKKGFTLVELLVAMACASIIFLGLGSAIYFTSKLSGEIARNTNNDRKVKIVRNYVISNNIIDDSTFRIVDDKLYDSSRIVIDGFDINDITISLNDDGFYECSVTYTQSDGEETLIFRYKGNE